MCSSSLKTLNIGAAAGCLHPEREGFFETPARYLDWYHREGPVQVPKLSNVRVAACTVSQMSWRHASSLTSGSCASVGRFRYKWLGRHLI